MVRRGQCSAFPRLLLQLNIDNVCHLTEVATEALAKPVAHADSAVSPAATATYAYDAGARRQTRTLGDATGTVTTWSYAGRQDNLVTGISISSSAQTMPSFGYTYNANQNKLSESITAPLNNYGVGDGSTYGPARYDDEDRLTQWFSTDSLRGQTWNLKLAGDWFGFGNWNPTTQSYVNWPTPTYNGVHELTKMGFATHLLYDPKGNMTNNGAGQVYAWDFNNRMETATVSGGTASTYAYDALGRRVSKAVGSATATVYVSDGDQEIAEYPLSGVAASPQMKYVYGQYIDEPVMMVNSSGTFYYHQNNLYSVSALTDSNGALQECYAYTPYGQVTFFGSNGVALSPQPSSSPLGNPFLFTGRRSIPKPASSTTARGTIATPWGGS